MSLIKIKYPETTDFITLEIDACDTIGMLYPWPFVTILKALFLCVKDKTLSGMARRTPFRLNQETPKTTSLEQTPDQPRRIPRWYLQTLKALGVTELGKSSTGTRRSQRIQDQSHNVFFSQVIEPQSYQEACKRKDWMETMRVEMDSILKNDTWTLVDRPPKRKVIGVKWVYKAKYKSDGTLNKYKARLVAKGYAKAEGIDYEETLAPTSRMTTIRMVVALAVHHG